MSDWDHITIDEFYSHRSDWNVVDIRDANSYQQGHIPGAVHLSNENVQQYIDTQDFEKPLVVVCYVGNSSQGAAQVLANSGFENVFSLDGGMTLWQSLYPDEMESN